MPTKRYARFLRAHERYVDLLRDNWDASAHDFRKIRAMLPTIKKLGFKRTIDEVRTDLQTIHSEGDLRAA